MSKTEVKEKLQNILKETIDYIEVDSDDKNNLDLIQEIGLDSIDFITLIIEIEEVFNVTIPDEYLVFDKYQSIYDLFDLIETFLLADQR